jgi:hypothetical protein
MYYIFQNGDDFGFKCNEIHEITESDILISDEIYQRFFDEQCGGRLLRVKDINGTTFEEIFEEYVLEYEETKEDKLIRLNNRLTEIDHMVAECSECNLLGLDLPYNVAELHEERKAIKIEIESL